MQSVLRVFNIASLGKVYSDFKGEVSDCHFGYLEVVAFIITHHHITKQQFLTEARIPQPWLYNKIKHLQHLQVKLLSIHS